MSLAFEETYGKNWQILWTFKKKNVPYVFPNATSFFLGMDNPVMEAFLKNQNSQILLSYFQFNENQMARREKRKPRTLSKIVLIEMHLESRQLCFEVDYVFG